MTATPDSRTDDQLMRVALVAMILLVAVLGFIGMLKMRSKPPTEPVTPRVPLVDVVDLVPTSVQFTVPSQGTVQPAVQTQISAEVSGTIVSMSESFVAGGTFDAGETLLQIEPELFRAAVNRAEATLRQRQVEYDGIKALDARNYRSKIDLAAAEAALAAARADLVRARNDLDKTRIRLPYAGIVRARQADVGQFVAPGTVLGTAFGSERVEVRLPLSENDLSFLDLPRTGVAPAEDAAPVTLSGRYRGRDTTWDARIVRTEATIDETNRVTYAVAEVSDPYRQDGDDTALPLPVGTFVAASIPGRQFDNVLTVPRYAVRGNGQLVFVNGESQLVLRDVDLIRSDREHAYVDAAQLTERRLVTTTLESPVNGQGVRIAGLDDSTTATGGAIAAESE
ncbi:MAG: efflux RND transporter periplasmic adaptor subunit [Pseudomonadota bacterium]